VPCVGWLVNGANHTRRAIPERSIRRCSAAGLESPASRGGHLLELGIKSLLAYLLGSMIGSLLIGRLRGGVDIRTLGSGNAGGTNALRTQGIAFAIWVMVIDIGKGILAAAALPTLQLPLIPIDPGIDRGWLAAACALAVVLGHVYPVWFGFRGGKGAATLIGVVIGLKCSAVLPLIIFWLVIVALTGFVGLATMLAVVCFPVYLLLFDHHTPMPLLGFAAAMAVFVCYTHRLNIQRMRSGTENRVQRLWLFRPR
jgi:acyl phosphate:glycerol-3-phosphate acyltransferase